MPETQNPNQIAIPKQSKLRRVVNAGLRILLILTGVWLLAGCMIQRRILFPRDLVQQSPNAKTNAKNLETLWLDTDDGKVEAWFLLGDGVSSKAPGPLVIFAHGNAELIDQNASDMKRYQQMGISVLLVEFRGYGRSAGSPTQKTITSDFAAFYDMMTKRADVDASRIVFHGRSVGGGVAFALAAKHQPKAMIVQSTFTSTRAMAAKFFMPGFIVLDPFDNLATIADLDCPVLLFHGKRDSIIPYDHSQQLIAAAKHGKLITYDCDHNDLPPDSNEYWKQIKMFLIQSNIIE